MVQKKVPSCKLGFQASEYGKSNKLLGNLKPSFQNQDAKKKTKILRSIKLSDMESLRSSSSKSPNYMKPTSSSDARKEISPVSIRSMQTCSDSKILRRRSLSSTNGDKTVKSLKMVRSLTKTTSFKTARGPVKKYCDKGLCVQRGTCSSILKDSKFPDYLELDHGGTEAAGISVMKVCPYTYCSLNGHYHAPLVPLKSFLKGRRRSMKSQKSTKNNEGDGSKVFDEKPECKEVDAGMEFFVEIYADAEVSFEGGFENLEEFGVKRGLDIGESCDTSSDMDITESHCEDEEDEYQSSISDEDATKVSFCGRIDFEQEWRGGIGDDEVYQSSHSGDDATQGSYGSIDDEMVWEEGQLFSAEIDNEVNCLITEEGESDRSIGCFSKVENSGLEDAPEIISDGFVSNCNDEIQADEILCKVLKEGSECSETQFDDGDSELYITNHISELDRLSNDQLLSTDYAFDETFISILITSAARNEPILEPIIANQEIPKMEIEINDTIKAADEAPNNNQENNLVSDEDDKSAPLFNQTFDQAEIEIQKVEELETEQNDVIHDFSLEQDLLNAKISQDFCEADQLITMVDDTESHWMTDPFHLEKFVEGSDSGHDNSAVENQLFTEKGQCEAKKSENSSSMDSNQNDSSIKRVSDSGENCNEEIDKMEMEGKTGKNAPEEFTDITSQELQSTFFHSVTSPNPEIPNTCNKIKWTIQCKKHINDSEEERKFNPREPNYLSLVPDPEAEKVDLKHQMMDDRKNSEEWMLDFALQQAVTKLAPARKKKVALLVEAFETVTPIPKNTTQRRHSLPAFAHTRPIQACN